MPNPEANTSTDCSKRIEVCFHVYGSNILIDYIHWWSESEIVTRTELFSVERFASKRGTIVTIISPQGFLVLQSIFVGLTVTASLGGLDVSYIW